MKGQHGRFKLCFGDFMRYYLSGKKNSYIASLENMLRDEGHEPSAEETDLFIHCIAPEAITEIDTAKLTGLYEEIALGLLRDVSEILPKMQKGKKRICFIISKSSSINYTDDKGGFEKIVLAGCNMAIATIFNKLSPEGFTFRVFAVEDFEKEDPSYALEYILSDRSLEEESYKHSDEKRVVMRDRLEREIPW